MYFLHYDDPTFERFGGIYVPFNNQEEAERQAANDLLDVQNDVKVSRLLGIFEAEYGSHKRIGSGVDGPIYDYNKPFGHLAKDERKKILSPSEIGRLATKHQKSMVEEANVATVKYLEEIEQSRREGRLFQGAVPGNAYSVVSGGTATGGAIALAAATAKTVLMIIAATANQPAWVEAQVSFDGVTATAVPVLCEWVSSTQAGAGTTTAFTPKQIRGWPAQGSQTTAAYNYTAEPTVLEVFKKRFLTPNGGLLVIQQPMGREPTGVVTASTQFKGMGIRLTAPAIVNCHVDAEFEE